MLPNNEVLLIPTDRGDVTPESLCNSLVYASYEANRGCGMSHESLVRLGIGNDAFKKRYEQRINA